MEWGSKEGEIDFLWEYEDYRVTDYVREGRMRTCFEEGGQWRESIANLTIIDSVFCRNRQSTIKYKSVPDTGEQKKHAQN